MTRRVADHHLKTGFFALRRHEYSLEFRSYRPSTINLDTTLGGYAHYSVLLVTSFF